MNYNIIQTGSSGNCTIINDIIAIDIGCSFHRLEPFYKNLQAVFITHAHSDHLKKSTVKKLAELRPNLKFVVSNYLVDLLLELGVKRQNIYEIDEHRWYHLGLFLCKLDRVPHDVPNVAIHLIVNGVTVLYVTDAGNLDEIEAKDYDYYFVEANYKEEELKQRRKDKKEKNEFVIEDRIEQTHLSHEECVNFILKNAKDTSVIELMHQHKNK